jgi:four helix bundle protein
MAVEYAEKLEVRYEPFARGHNPLVEQLRRGALSISPNIAEDGGCRHPGDMKQDGLIARESVFECVPLVELSKRQGWIDVERCQTLKEEPNISGRM